MGFNDFNNQNRYMNISQNNVTQANRNNYNNAYTPVNNIISSSMNNSMPISIGFVQGRMGASVYPVMSSNTTVYLFDTQDQSKFYIKATDAFGMALPLREFTYQEVFVQYQNQINTIPAPTQVITDSSTSTAINETDNSTITREEFNELKNQLSDFLQSQKVGQNQSRPRKERSNNG